MENFRKILGGMNTAAICIIEKESHTIIYYNQTFKKFVPTAEISLGCYEIGLDFCEQCPVKSYEKQLEEGGVFLRNSRYFGGPVEIMVDEIMWEEMFPSYIITIIPQMASEEIRDYYIHDRAMDMVVDKICKEVICCNLTQNTYKNFKWDENDQFQCAGEGKVDEILEELVKRMLPADQRRCRKINTAKKMESYFRNGGKCLYDELQLKSEKGDYKWISNRVLPLANVDDEDQMAVIVLRDIHTRRSLQEQMRHNLSATYKAIPGGVCSIMLDDKLTMISANQEFYKMLGKQEEDYADGYLGQIHPMDRNRVAEYVHKIRESGGTIDITYRLTDIRGEIHWVQARGIPYGEANGYPVYLMLRTDITLIMAAQKQIEEEQAKFKRYADKVIDTLSNLVEFRDVDSGEHIKRTKNLTRIMLECYNRKFPEQVIEKERMEKIVLASALHDVGKITISDTILNKPGKLTEEEMEIMKTHTTKGYEIIEALDLNEDAQQKQYSMDIAKYHHERWDGNGYPEQLKGDEIPFWSQVVSIVDVYDALVSTRVYKEAYTHEQAMEMILNGECGVFNPVLLECLQDTAELLKNEYK